MKLKEVLKLHREFNQGANHGGALKQSLGDGYLLKRNPVFQNVRTAALEFGFRFESARFHDYDTMSLTQLPTILKTKTIPYYDNVRPLRAIEKKAPGRFNMSELPPLKSNYAFHESAHAVAHFLYDVYVPGKAKSESDLILRALLEESFANAAESLANIFITIEADRFFLSKNAYILETARVREDLIRCANVHGLPMTFQVLLLSFLHANFLKTKNSAQSFNRVLKIVDGDSLKDKGSLRKVFRVGFDLDPEFTIFTNGFCLKLVGVKKKLPEALQFDFLSAFEEGGRLQKLFWVMSEVVAPAEWTRSQMDEKPNARWLLR